MRVFVLAVVVVAVWWPARAVAEGDDPVPSTVPVTVPTPPTTEATVPVSTVPSVRPPPANPARDRHREAHRGARRLRRPYTASRSDVPVTATTSPAVTTTTTLGGLFVSPPPLAQTTTTVVMRARHQSRAVPVPTATITPAPVRWSRSDLTIVGVLLVVAVGAFAGAYRLRKVRR